MLEHRPSSYRYGQQKINLVDLMNKCKGIEAGFTEGGGDEDNLIEVKKKKKTDRPQQ